MHLKAKEDDIYKLMDQRDRWLVTAGGCGSGCVLLLFFTLHGYWSWEILYFLVVFFVVVCFLLYHIWKISKQIVEVERCYMELDEDSLAVYQPNENGQYEACRIFYQEIEKIVEGSRKGMPTFYVVLKDDYDRKSFILLNEKEQMRKIFQVRSLGYQHKEFKMLYRKLRLEMSNEVQIIGTKYQTVWDMKATHKEPLLLGYVGVVYLFLKTGFIFGIL